MQPTTPPSISLFREGITAGAIGATAVAIWFFFIDLIVGHPLQTPAVLGNGFFSFFGPTSGESATMHIVGYTVVHYVAFSAVGIGAAFMIGVSEKVPAALAGLLILFVAFQLAFYGVTAILSMSDALGSMAWWSIGAANLIAAAGMGRYLYRRHPNIKQTLEYALSGRE